MQDVAYETERFFTASYRAVGEGSKNLNITASLLQNITMTLVQMEPFSPFCQFVLIHNDASRMALAEKNKQMNDMAKKEKKAMNNTACLPSG
ncbi:hypothetical protein T10_1438 [Trichinella papuae]|uniref:Uncharacterized protein n=1 Tax=Trichinella papuae TaxID=268474 RepID=A0A0V1MP55_9BILA|nr:hypothetical protein T10_1438 [Trichinella papuae]